MNTLSSLLTFIGSFEPVGSVKMYAGSSAPSKWLFCQGQAVSRTTYAKLFAAIGTTYGAGDGSTTFNLPDFRGRTAIGAGTGTASGATAHALGQREGAETVLLTDQQVAHGHSFTQPTISVNTNGSVSEKAAFNTGGMSAHETHTHTAKNGGAFVQNGTGDWNADLAGGTYYKCGSTTASASVAHTHSVPAHTHGFTNPTYKATGGSVANLHGASNTRSAHSNMQPYTAINYIIFAGV